MRNFNMEEYFMNQLERMVKLSFISLLPYAGIPDGHIPVYLCLCST